MSQVTPSTTGSALPAGRQRLLGWVAMGATVVVLGWSMVELIGLVQRGHTVGAELYGLLVAALAVVAGILSLVLIASPRRRRVAVAAVVILWAAIALGGIAGAVAHLVGPVPGHGPVDDRPRPARAPLVFTVFGVVGGGALIYGSRTPTRGRQS
jgi:hypothetical protein